jgi:xylulokinase
MKGTYVLGIDVGTQGVKAAIFDKDGVIAGSGFRSSELIQPAPGVTEEDPQTQYSNVCLAIKEAISRGSIDPRHIAAIALDGQMAGVIGIDDQGNAVTPYDSWLDTRCSSYIKHMRSVAIEEVTRKTGNAPSFNHGPKILWWKGERPEVYRNIAKFVQPTGYIALRLAGLRGDDAFIDHTYLHFSGFADNANGKWSETLLQTFDVSVERMPRILEPTDWVGEISNDASKETGLAQGTAIFAGTGDTAASFLAAGAVEAGLCVDVSGTASVFAATTSEFRPDLIDGMLGVGRSAIPGLWHPYAYVNGGGMNLEWFRSLAESIRGSHVSFDELSELAESEELSPDHPVFVPHLAGRMSPSDPDMRGAWIGLTWSHNVGVLYRTILEGIALEYQLYKERLLAVNPEQRVRELRNTGGGNSSRVWRQIKADTMNVPVVEIPSFSGATHGVAMVAAVGAGLQSTIAEVAGRWVRTGSVTNPEHRDDGIIDERLSLYREALEKMQGYAG